MAERAAHPVAAGDGRRVRQSCGAVAAVYGGRPRGSGGGSGLSRPEGGRGDGGTGRDLEQHDGSHERHQQPPHGEGALALHVFVFVYTRLLLFSFH